VSKTIQYLIIGLVFAAVVEVINMGILGGNWVGMVTTLLIVYSLFVMIGYKLRNIGPVIQFAIMGAIGLILIEWILIGTPPTGSQSILTLFIFQGGIFIYWATVGVAPRLFLDESENARKIKRGFTRFYLGWFALVYIVGLVFTAGNIRFVFMQTTSALGHLLLLRFYIAYFK
jgi:hypothetical protein